MKQILVLYIVTTNSEGSGETVVTIFPLCILISINLLTPPTKIFAEEFIASGADTARTKEEIVP